MRRARLQLPPRTRLVVLATPMVHLLVKTRNARGRQPAMTRNATRRGTMYSRMAILVRLGQPRQSSPPRLETETRGLGCGHLVDGRGMANDNERASWHFQTHA